MSDIYEPGDGFTIAAFMVACALVTFVLILFRVNVAGMFLLIGAMFNG